MKPMIYLPDGQLVCDEHHLVTCGDCRMDFAGSGFVRVDEDDRVFVRGPGVNQFVPQWDEQVLGPANVIGIKTDCENIPELEHLQASALLACSKCQLTWLVGRAGCDATASHPSHHTLLDQYSGTARSLVVHTDGSCIDNGRAKARAGIGVYFGPGSRYNVSAPLEASIVPTNQAAELYALLQAMQVIRKDFVHARSILVPGNYDSKRLRLVLVTDSSYAVECMCRHWKNWTIDDEQKVLKNRQGKEIVNSKLLLAIKDEVKALSLVGVQVVYYHVPRELNEDADALARAGIAPRAERQSAEMSNGSEPLITKRTPRDVLQHERKNPANRRKRKNRWHSGRSNR